VLAGDGADSVTLGTGDHTVFGDNGLVTYVAMDATGEGRLLRAETTDTVQLTGGNDVISVGSGDNTILGGMGNDQITAVNNGASVTGTVAGMDVIIGDNGFVQMDVVGGLFAQISTKSLNTTTGAQFVAELGGNDTINSGTGTKIVLAGDGADTVNAGLGTSSDHTIVGDNGVLTYVAIGQAGAGRLLRAETTDMFQLTGGNDVIKAGDGNNTILGGMGNDQITTGAGTDTVFGDNGFVQMDVQGNNFAQIGTKSLSTTTGVLFVSELGGDDTIRSGNGDKRILGGDGSDTIAMGGSDHTVAGDNATVTYVAIGQVGAGRLLRFETTDTVQLTGGNDSIKTGDGTSTIAGGMGADTIETGNGAETILGDNGFVQMDMEGNNFAQISTKSLVSTTGFEFVAELGGNDTITSLTGNKRVLAGDGADTVTMGDGNHVVFGDNGYVTFVAIGEIGAGNELTYATTDTVPPTGGDDTITVGNGNNTILGGMGMDKITTGNGVDTILGDNGLVNMDATGTMFEIVTSTVTTQGANNTITSGDGDKNILAGLADDTVSVGTGTHILLGDNGTIRYSATGIRAQINTIELYLGGNDRITAADGDTIVIAGLGNDFVTTGNGDDVQLGDNGYIFLDSLGRLLSIDTSVPAEGGSDVLAGGGGNDILMGGYGVDSISGGTGNDALLGDGGRARYSGGLLVLVESIDPFIGNADSLDGGAGANAIIGGDGDDLTTGSLNNDLLVGDYASVVFDASGNIKSVIRYGAGNDLIASMQESLFTFVRPADKATVVVSVYTGSFDRLGASTVDETRLRDYLAMPTLLGFEYSSQVRHSDSGSGPSIGTQQGSQDGAQGQQQGAPGQEQEQQQERGSSPSGDGGQGGQQAPGGGPDGAPGQQGQPDGNPVDGQQEGAELNTPADQPAIDLNAGMPADVAGLRGAFDSARPLELALAGLVGVQAWQRGRAPQAPPARMPQVSGEGRGGKWIRTADGETMLDRRSQPRKGRAADSLKDGVLEQTAEAWMGRSIGAPSGVQAERYESRPASRFIIDWGQGSAPGAAEGKDKAPK
jgi:Ca2+-binding RTX toxin-like protein